MPGERREDRAVTAFLIGAFLVLRFFAWLLAVS